MDNAITVSQLNRYLKLKMDHDVKLTDVYVSGEISNFVSHKSGHFYFSLKDDGAAVKAVMFSQFSSKVKFNVENGQKVVLRGQVSVFERDGIYQIYVKEIIPDGVGALSLAFEQLKEKLLKQGLFNAEHKKNLPCFPEKIGVITSPTGAAFQDILNIISRRFPMVDVCLYPAIVQGDGAVKTLINGIEYFNYHGKVDVILLGRGGGSLEDLWCFNNEKLAYAIFNSSIPIISCVGHETDFTIADFVADLRAPTPSAAAELAVPDKNTVLYRLSELHQDAQAFVISKISRFDIAVSALKNRPCLTSSEYYVKNRREKLFSIMQKDCLRYPERILEKKEKEYLNLKKRMDFSVEKKNLLLSSSLSQLSAKLDALSPLKVLSRGYSLVVKDEKVASIKQISVDDKIAIKMNGGSLDALVIEKVEDN